MFQHMNHGSAFQALWKQLRTEVRNLQDRGYYGDGPSFSPSILASPSEFPSRILVCRNTPRRFCQGSWRRDRSRGSSRIHGTALKYTVSDVNLSSLIFQCGGAQTRSRPSATRRRRSGRRGDVVPSNHTGRQTAKRRKGGGRVTSKYAFQGEGLSLNDSTGEEGGKGTGFRKQAGRYVFL